MRVLVVGPRFHGYCSAVSSALEAIGHEARVHEYDRVNGFLPRARNKAVHDLPSGLVPAAWQQEATDRAVRVLRETAPQAVLVLKGDLLGAAWWEELLASDLRCAVWFYDELSRMEFPDQLLHQLPAVATYSRADAAQLTDRGMPAMHLPLAFDSRLSYCTTPQETVSFIGARYGERVRLLCEAAELGVPVRAYGREWSGRLLDMAATRKLPVQGVPGAPQLDRAESYGVMAGSLASINTHSHQDGFTMRTFEVPGVGGIELVDRRDVEELYEPDREVLVFDSAAHLAQLVERVRTEPGWARQIRERGRAHTMAEHTFVHRMRTVEALWA